MPRATPSMILDGVPTPIRYLGLSTGIHGSTASMIRGLLCCAIAGAVNGCTHRIQILRHSLRYHRRLWKRCGSMIQINRIHSSPLSFCHSVPQERQKVKLGGIMLDFNLKQLEAFVAAAELGSFTKAAQSLYLTQSTVSAHIQTLERALGISLFARSARKKICLTDAGREAYSKAKEILDQCQALADAVHPKRTMEVLSIAASTGIQPRRAGPGPRWPGRRAWPGSRPRWRWISICSRPRLLKSGNTGMG